MSTTLASSCPTMVSGDRPNKASGVPALTHRILPEADTPSKSRRSFSSCALLLRCTVNAQVLSLLPAWSVSMAKPPTAAAGVCGMILGMTYTGVLLDVNMTLVMPLRQLFGQGLLGMCSGPCMMA